jgi:hypothetical protein
MYAILIYSLKVVPNVFLQQQHAHEQIADPAQQAASVASVKHILSLLLLL